MTVLINGMQGLGDNIMQRPFVRAMAAREQVYLRTPWPEIYGDLPLKLLKSETRLRTQSKNEKRSPAQWAKEPLGVRHLRIAYGAGLAFGSITSAMETLLPLHGAPFVFDLPDFGPSPIAGDYALIRPVTVRSEWFNSARNPEPEQVAWVASRLRQDGLKVVLAADIDEPHETLCGPLPPHDVAFLKGELRVAALLAAVRHAKAVIGGVGWILPAAIACRVPAFIILGGHGGHNAPVKVTDPRMDLSRIGWATPDRFCRCTNMRHVCDKKNSHLVQHFEAWAAHIALPKAA